MLGDAVVASQVGQAVPAPKFQHQLVGELVQLDEKETAIDVPAPDCDVGAIVQTGMGPPTLIVLVTVAELKPLRET